MRFLAEDGVVVWSVRVTVFIAIVSSTKLTEPIEMSFRKFVVRGAEFTSTLNTLTVGQSAARQSQHCCGNGYNRRTSHAVTMYVT